MTPIWLEVLLGFAVPLGWAFWELYALRRDRRRAEAEAARDAAAGGRPPPGRSGSLDQRP